MWDFEAYQDFRRNEESWGEVEDDVYCCNCGRQVHPDEIGEYTDVETGEPACGSC